MRLQSGLGFWEHCPRTTLLFQLWSRQVKSHSVHQNPREGGDLVRDCCRAHTTAGLLRHPDLAASCWRQQYLRDRLVCSSTGGAEVRKEEGGGRRAGWRGRERGAYRWCGEDIHPLQLSLHSPWGKAPGTPVPRMGTPRENDFPALASPSGGGRSQSCFVKEPHSLLCTLMD